MPVSVAARNFIIHQDNAVLPANHHPARLPDENLGTSGGREWRTSALIVNVTVKIKRFVQRFTFIVLQ